MSNAVPFGLPVDDVLAADIKERLAAVEELLLECARDQDQLLTKASHHLVAAGGKRFRPMLVLLASHFGKNPVAPGVVTAAVVVELTHLATLYHDDVMDEASMRRGRESANLRWTNTIAILTGDYLFARASDLLADLGPEAIRVQTRAFNRLVRGQIQETVRATGTDPVKHYLQVVADKTASLIAASGHFGAMQSGAPPHVVATVTSACEKIGVAFQLSDDILDIASESDQSGKTPGTDLREGIPTLPVLHVLASNDTEDDRLRELLTSDLTADDAAHAEALALLRAHPAMDRARADLQQWADEARAEVLTLPDLPVRAAFEGLCNYVVSRTG